MRLMPPSRPSKGFAEGVRVQVITGADAKRAAPGGVIVAVREVSGRSAYMVRHDCGRLRTWRSVDLGKEATRPSRRA